MKLTSFAKKTLSVLLALMLIVSAFAVGAIPASAAGGDTIYFEKPASWSDSVYIYFWSGSGPMPSNLYDFELTHVSGSIYSYTFEGNVSEFLFDDGQSGGHQTVNLKFPGNGYVCKVLSTGSKNDWGNFCNDAQWSKYSPGLAVSAYPGDSDFMNSIKVTLSASEAASASYKLGSGAAVDFKDGDVITIGEDAAVGDVIKLELTASDGTDTKTAKYSYTKVSTPVASSVAYFDNSAFGWDEVYIYAYGTKENAEWPGEKMHADESGLFYAGFTSAFKSENVIFNNGREKDDGKEQFPANSGLSLNAGECKLFTADKQWVDYGTPDGKPAGFAYTASGTAFSDDVLNVKIGLKNAVKGTYRVDDGSEFEYTGTQTIAVGQGAIGNSRVKLTLTATNENGVKTSNDYFYKKTFTPSKTTFSSPSDGHTSEAVSGNYGTNPGMQLGKSKTITVDGDPSDWDSSMIIAQGVANDDPRVYMPSAMHEQPWDDYALYAAWDNDNLYFMWEMANTTYIVSPSDNFAASQEARPWRNSIPIYIALSVNPEIHADGTAWGTTKTGAEFTNPFVWGCVGGTAKDGGVKFKTNVDTLIAFDTNNSNGGASIFKADNYDEANDNYMFNYDTAIPIGVTSFEKQDNQNGFKIAKDYGTLSTSLLGVGGAKGSHTVGDSLSAESNWVDFFDLGYKNSYGFIYEVAVPLKNLGIDKDYIEKNGIGAMQILSYGTSGMDSLPYDATMQDNADVEYSYDPSTSHEKEDVDEITVPLARIGAFLKDTQFNEAPFEVNFGTDKAGTQGVGSTLALKAEAYNGSENYSYDFTVNGSSVQNGAADSFNWTPSAQGEYKLGVTVTDSNGKKASAEKTINIGTEAPPVTEPPTQPPTQKPTDAPTSPATEPVSSVTEPTTPVTEPQTKPSDVPSSPATEPQTAVTEPQTSATEPQTSVTEPATAAPATEPAPATTPKLKKSSVSLKAGKTATITVLNKGTNKLSFKSSNSKVASVKNGKVTALKKGTAKITVTVGKTKLTYTVKVTTSPKLSKSSVTVKKNATATVKITGKTTSVKNKYVNTKTAKIISKTTATTLKVKGLKKGKTTLKIKVNGVALKLKVTVK